MDYLWWTFLLFVGATIGACGQDIYTMEERKSYKEYQKLIAECEKNLPRTQNCTLVAKPKEEGK